MSESVQACCIRLHRAGKSLRSISRTVSLPEEEVYRAVI